MFAMKRETLAKRNNESLAENFSMSYRIEGPKRKIAIQADEIKPNMTHARIHISKQEDMLNG